MTKTEEKLDKIIKLLEEIKATQSTVFFPSVYYLPIPEPQPYIAPLEPWPESPQWITTCDEETLYQ